MSVGPLRTLTLVLAVLLAVVVATDGSVEDSNASVGDMQLVEETIPVNSDASFDGTPLLTYRVGDRFVYVNNTHDATIVLTIQEPVMAAAANLTKVHALPILVNVTVADHQFWAAHLMDMGSGDLVISPDACLVDPGLPCQGGDQPGFRWSCPLDGVPGVANYLMLEDLDQSVVVLEDPIQGMRFPYGVERNPGTVRLELIEDEVPDGQVVCAQRTAVTVDLDGGLVTAMTIDRGAGGAEITLAEWTPGDGPTVAFAGEPSRGSLLLPPESSRTDVYPPGYGQVGPTEWTLGEALDGARDGHPPYTQWLAEHPDAFLYEPRLTTLWSETLGVLHSETYRWTLDVLSPDREMVRLTAEKKIVQNVLSLASYDMEEVSVPDDVPPTFQPPSQTSVRLQGFLDAMAGHGYDPASKLVNPVLYAGFNGVGDGAFVYDFAVETEEMDPDTSASQPGFVFVVDTGRLGGGALPRASAQELVG